MDHSPNEPLFTPKEWLIVLSVWFVFAATVFSMDPEWIGWAAPLVFGGALVATGPPPNSMLSTPPREVFEPAFLVSLLSIAVLELLQVHRGEPWLGWLGKLRVSLRGGGFRRRARRFQRLELPRDYDARALQSTRRESSIGQEIWQRYPASAQGRVTTSSQRSRIIPRGLRLGGPEDHRSLH
jgi:hypothetical protein